MNYRVSVFMNENALNANVRVFERLISWNDDIQYPFAQTVNVMKVLFGSKCIVQFDVC